MSVVCGAEDPGSKGTAVRKGSKGSRAGHSRRGSLLSMVSFFGHRSSMESMASLVSGVTLSSGAQLRPSARLPPLPPAGLGSQVAVTM